ncbi:UNVERIFIED_CONTAM: hypothetical protein FKN15_055496 [Acipenser sinensis]
MGTVQYNHEGAGYDIAAVCDIMVGGGEGESSYTRLTHVLKVRGLSERMSVGMSVCV